MAKDSPPCQPQPTLSSCQRQDRRLRAHVAGQTQNTTEILTPSGRQGRLRQDDKDD